MESAGGGGCFELHGCLASLKNGVRSRGPTQMDLESPRVTPVTFHLTGGQTLISTCQVGHQLISQTGEKRHYHRLLDVQRQCLGELMGFIFAVRKDLRICNTVFNRCILVATERN